MPDAKLTLVNTHISGGAAFVTLTADDRMLFRGYGGAVLNQGEIILRRVTLENNIAQKGSALFSIGPTTIADHSLIKGNGGYVFYADRINSSSGTAVQIRCRHPQCGFPVKIEDSIFRENTAEGSTLDISGIESPQIINSAFLNNRNYLGIIRIASNDILISGSSIHSNLVMRLRPEHYLHYYWASSVIPILDLPGGFDASNIRIISSAIIGNVGKGISVFSCAPYETRPISNFELVDVTIFGNFINDSAEERPITTIFWNDRCMMKISNTVLANNHPRNCLGNALEVTNRSIDDDGTCQGLDTLSNYGIEDTGYDGDLDWYAELTANSRLIDAGEACLETDQLGTVRPQDGDGDNLAHCDIGSVEIIRNP